MDNLNNIVRLAGEIISDFDFSHESYGEGFYIFYLRLRRYSGTNDILPILVSERLLDVTKSAVGATVVVNGQFRSFNKRDETGSHLLLTVFARDIENEDISEDEHRNAVCFEGYICKKPIFRKTPLGREVADLLLAVNRPYGKTDYLPCILWGRNARFISTLSVGTKLSIVGRIQSRTYKRTFEDKERVAYEVSVTKVEVTEDE